MGDLRLQLGTKFNLADPAALRFLWVVDFPLFEYGEEDKRLASAHHPSARLIPTTSPCSIPIR